MLYEVVKIGLKILQSKCCFQTMKKTEHGDKLTSGSAGKSGDRVCSWSLHSMFSLTVQYSICPSILPSSQSAQSHVWAQYAQNHSSRRHFHPRCVMGLSLPNQLHLMILHTNIIGSSEAVKGSCVSSQTPKNSQTNAQKLTADNTEGSLVSGRNPFYPSLVEQLFLSAVKKKKLLCQQVWTRVKKLRKSVRSPAWKQSLEVPIQSIFNFTFHFIVALFHFEVLILHKRTKTNTTTNKFKYSQQKTILTA